MVDAGLTQDCAFSGVTKTFDRLLFDIEMDVIVVARRPASLKTDLGVHRTNAGLQVRLKEHAADAVVTRKRPRKVPCPRSNFAIAAEEVPSPSASLRGALGTAWAQARMRSSQWASACRRGGIFRRFGSKRPDRPMSRCGGTGAEASEIRLDTESLHQGFA